MINIKNLLKRSILLFLLLTSLNISTFANDRKIALQTYSFHQYTLEQTLEMLDKMGGIDTVEIFPKQVLTASKPKVLVGPDMNDDDKQYLRDLLKKYNIKVCSYGVSGGGNAIEIEKICKFAKEFGIKRVLVEPWEESMLEIWDKMAAKYSIDVCIHHHGTDAKKNKYYDPKHLLSLVQKYKNVRANPDIGHWARSGIDPIEALKIIGVENIGSIHFKDMKKFDDLKNECVPFGTGALNLKAILKYLDKNNYKSYFVIEYEGNKPNKIDSVAHCIDFLRKN